MKKNKIRFKLPGWTPNSLFTINEVVIEITKKCNLKCEHCGANSSPSRSEILDINFLRELIIQLGNNNFKKIVITGGEPFLYIEHLNVVTRYCNKYGIEIQIVTNGFWGKYPNNYMDFLSEFSKNQEATLVFSVDLIHNKYIPKENILSALKFIKYKNLKIKSQIYTIEFYQDYDFLNIIHELFSDVSIFSQPILLVGRAKDNENKLKTKKYILTPQKDDHPCHMVLYPYINSNREWYICSNASVGIGRDNFAKIGRINNPNEISVYINKHLSNNLFRFLRDIGPYKLIQQIHPELLSQRVTSICELCIEIIQEKETNNYINDIDTRLLLDNIENIIKTSY